MNSPSALPSTTHLVAVFFTLLMLTSTVAAVPSSSGVGPSADIAGVSTEASAAVASSYCIVITTDGETSCSATSEIDMTYLVVSDAEPNTGEVRVELTSSAVPQSYEVQARLDNGQWSSAAFVNGNALLRVMNEYPAGTYSVNLQVRVLDDSRNVVAERTTTVTITVESASSTTTTSPSSTIETSSDANGSATVVTSDLRHVRDATYTFVGRFNDGDEVHEAFEDKSLPPVVYDVSQRKVSKPVGDIYDFGNLREANGLPAVFNHNNGYMNLGVAIFGVNSADYAKIRLDYALQTLTASQTVQVRLVDQYGKVIDPTMEDAPSRQLTETLPDTFTTTDFENRKQYEQAVSETNLNTQTFEFALTDTERAYLSDNHVLYVTFESNADTYLLLYRAPAITQSTYNKSDEYVVNLDTYFEEEFNANPGSDAPATFNAQYRVISELNQKYESFDVRPNEKLSLQVTVTNGGDSRVERQIGILDESEHHPGDATVLREFTVTVEPHSTTTRKVEISWDEHEFGNHEITVVDSTDSTPTKLPRERDGVEVSDVYVFQPATFKVVDIKVPDSHLVHDNFNSIVVVQNVGDLDGTAKVHGKFEQWSSPTPLTTSVVKGGNVREGRLGEKVEVKFDRNGKDYSPSHPASPATRPNSPYSKTVSETGYVFTATVLNDYASPDPVVWDKVKSSLDSDPVRVYELYIVDMRISGNHIDSGDTFFASAWPYTVKDPENPDMGFDTDTEWANYLATVTGQTSSPGLPIYTGATHIHSPLNADGSGRMVATVTVENPGTAPTGTARIAIVSGTLEGVDGTVLGTAGIELGPWQSKTIDIPVVIKNKDGIAGTHDLKAVVRTTTPDDYITGYEPSTNSGDAARTVSINLESWEYFVFDHMTETYQEVAENCNGYNPSNPAGEQVNCYGGTPTDYSFDVAWDNLGGESHEFEANTYVTHESGGNGAAIASEFSPGWIGGSEFFEATLSDWYAYGTWDSKKKTVAPGAKGTYTASGVQFTEPGYYRVQPYIERLNLESAELNGYNDTGPTSDFHVVKVVDVTEPAAYWSISDTTFATKSGESDHSPGTLQVYEGGTLQFDARDSIDNVRITEYYWTIAGAGPNFAPRTCLGNTCYSQTFSGTRYDSVVEHRFNTDGSYTVTVRTKDDGALTSSGTPNQDTYSVNVDVVNDGNPPTAGLTNDKGTKTVYRSDSTTGFGGTQVCFTASASDGEIGIESDSWTGIGGSGDSRCRTWSTDGSKVVSYEAWDFVGLSDYVENTINVKTDSTGPSVTTSASPTSVYHSYSSSKYYPKIKFTIDASDSGVGIWDCGYSWSGVSGTSCSNTASRSWSSPSKYTITGCAKNLHDYESCDDVTITVKDDTTDPTASDESVSCDTDESDEDGCSVSTCITTSDVSDGETGVWYVESDNCVTASADASATAPSDCKKTGTDTHGWNTDSKTVTFYDRHGNPGTATITASARDYDEASNDCKDADNDGYYPNTAIKDPDYDPDDMDNCNPNDNQPACATNTSLPLWFVLSVPALRRKKLVSYINRLRRAYVKR